MGKRLVLALLCVALWLPCHADAAFKFTGVSAVWAMHPGDFVATPFPGTDAGIASALDYTSLGGRVELGSGTWTLSSDLVMSPGQTLQGAGSGATYLTWTNTGANGIRAATSCRILDMTLYGPAGSTGTGILGGVGGPTLDVVIERVHVEGFSTGINTGIDGHLWRIKDDIVKLNTSYNVVLAAGSNLCTVTATQISGDPNPAVTTGTGIVVSGADNTVSLNKIVNNHQFGVFLTSATGGGALPECEFNNILGNLISGSNQQANIAVAGTSGRITRGNNILGNRCFGGLVGIRVTGALGGSMRANRIGGNIVYGNTSHAIWQDASGATEMLRQTYEGNQIEGNVGTSILIDNATSNSTSVLNNAIGGNGTDAVTVTGGAVNTRIVQPENATIARLGPYSTATTGGAIRIVDGVTFPKTIAGVQAANDEFSGNGGEIWVPINAGIPVVTTPLKLSNKVTLRSFGQYNGTPTFVCSAATNVPFVIGPSDTTGGQQYFAVEDVEIDGQKSTGARVDAGIKMRKIFVGTRLVNDHVHDVSGVAFRIGGDNVTATGQMYLENCIASNGGDWNYVIEGGIRSVWMVGCTSERPGRKTGCLKIDGSGTTSAGNIGVGVDHFYTEVTDSMSVGILVNGASNVQISNYTACIPSGRMRSAIQISNTNTGNFGFSPSGVTVTGLYAESDTLIEDLQNSRTITTGADFNNPYRFLNWWTSPDATGSASTNGYRNSGQVIGMQTARFGPDIASAATIVPHPNGGDKYTLTGTTTSTDVTFYDSFIGKTLIFTSAAAVQITSGNHWKLNGNWVANGTGNNDTLTGYVDGSKNFIESGRTNPP